MEHPSVQQQHRHPQKSHRTLTGRVLRRVTLTRLMVALNSSGATRACRAQGNSVSKRLDRPKLKREIEREFIKRSIRTVKTKEDQKNRMCLLNWRKSAVALTL